MNLIRQKTLAVVLMLLLVSPLLSGCWDQLEIDERGIVLGIGIDKSDHTLAKPEDVINHPSGKVLHITNVGLIKISVQIAVPGRIPLGPGEGGGGGGGGKTVWIVEAEGYSIADALTNLQQRISRPLFFGHLRIIVISETVARLGIEDMNDYFRRNPEVRRTNWMVICKGKASDVIRASPQLERFPTLYLVTTMEQSVKMGRLPNDSLGIFWSAVSSKGKAGYLPYIELMKNDNVQISGLGLFTKNKLVAITTTKQIIYYMGIVGVKKGGGEGYVKPEGINNYFMFQSRTRKSRFDVTVRNGEPRVRVRTTIEGNLLSKSRRAIPINREVIDAIEKQIEKQDIKRYKELISMTQTAGADIFGFGEYIRARLPEYWNEHIQTSDHWIEQYRKLHVDVELDVHIRRVGMKAT